MQKTIHLADNLTLPLTAVTEKLAFLGRTSSGKTYAGTKLCEEMLEAQAHVVALDPVGKWHGLRLGKDGKSKGYAIPVFGGLYGDVPLEPTAGFLVADLIVDKKINAVLDVSQFILSEQTRFAYDFATRFYQRQKAEPSAVHLFIEECQEFIPQNLPGGGDKLEARMLHAFERMWKLGRNAGIGGSLISQRPQEINKKVLNMSECLFVFQMTGPQEKKAIELYVGEKGLDVSVVKTLPYLKQGDCHVWSPVWLDRSEVIHIAEKKTFDASATPKVGAKIVTPKELSPIDVEQIREAMAVVVERSKAEDPKEMRRLISELKLKVATLEATSRAQPATVRSVEKPVVKIVEKPIFKDSQIKRLETISRAIGKKLDGVAEMTATVREFTVSLDGLLRNATGNGNAAQSAVRPEPAVSMMQESPKIARGKIKESEEYDMADFEEFYQKTVQRLQQDGFAVTVRVEPKEVVLKEFQHAEVSRILADTQALGDFAKQSLRWLESRGQRATKAEILRAVTGKDAVATSGSVRTERYNQIEQLIDLGLAEKDSNGVASNITASVAGRLSNYNASPSDVDEVIGQVLLQLH